MRKPIEGEGAVFPPYGRYHHGIVVDGAQRLLFLSGQLGIARDGTVPEGVDAQARLVFENIDALLAEAGMSRCNLVRLTTYLLDPAHRAEFMGGARPMDRSASTRVDPRVHPRVGKTRVPGRGRGDRVGMRILWLYAHPCPESFHGALQGRAVAAARAAGHEVDLCDLVDEGFDPVMRADERRRYHDPQRNREGLEPWIQRILQAEWLVCQFPVWGFGPPAILKGFFDRTFLPDLAFDLSNPRKVRSKFTHLRRVTGLTSYGQDRLKAFWMGDLPRKFVTRYLAWYAGSGARIDYLAMYGMNAADAGARQRFIERAEAHFRS